MKKNIEAFGSMINIRQILIGIIFILFAKIALAASADIAITALNDNPDPVYENCRLTYTIWVYNYGPDDATGVSVTDTLPDGVSFYSANTSQGSCSGTSSVICDLGTVIKGTNGQARIDISVTHNSTCTLVNTASITSSYVPDPYLYNNSETSVTAVKSPLCNSSDLSVTVTDSTDPVAEDSNITYIITVENKGPDDATGVIIKDSTAEATIFDLVSVTSSMGTCSYPTCVGIGCLYIDSEPQRITCEIDYLPYGFSATIELIVSPPSGTYTNTAGVISDVFDPDYSNNSDTENTTVASANNHESGGGGGGGGCFIATAAYGSSIQPYVKLLSDFRDQFLLVNPVGKGFVRFYNTHSPPIANFIAKHNNLRAMVRISLLPVVGVSWLALKFGLIPTMVLMPLLFFGFIGIACCRRKIKKS